MQLSVNVFQFDELSKAAQKVVVEKYLDNGWYDYSDHERSEYNKSLEIFNSAFASLAGLGGLKGQQAKEAIVMAMDKAARIQAAANRFYAETFNEKFNGKISNIEQAMQLTSDCSLTGLCTDYYLLDTIHFFLNGEKHQDLDLSTLIDTAKKDGRNHLQKQCRFYRTKGHVQECLAQRCEDWFYEDGSDVPPSLVKIIEAQKQAAA